MKTIEANKAVKRIALVAFNGVTEMSIGIARDVFSAANMALYKTHPEKTSESDEIASSIKVLTHNGEDVISFGHAVIHADASISEEDHFDLIALSGFWGDIRQILSENSALIEWLKRQNKKGTTIFCVHAGSFFLAEAGLLDGKVATVYWRMVDSFKARYKKVILMPEKNITVSENLYCASGISSAIEAMSYLVEKLWGFDIAQKVSRNFLMDFPRQNTQFNLALNDQKQHKDERILAAQSWIESHFSSEFLMEELADKVGLSLRNLSRRFKNSTGNTPNQYLQKVRIEIAKDLLKITEMSVDQITYRVGYVDVSSFCKLFKKVTQQTPSEYRAENNL